MKKLLVLMSMMVLSLALVACSGGDEGESADGEKTLKVWAMGEEGKKLKDFVKDFEENNPKITVDVQAIPWGKAHDKLLTAVASGNGPDVLQIGTTWVPEFAEAGAFKDLSEYMDDYESFNKDNFFDGSVSTMKYNDQVVGVPWYVDTRVMYYRTDLLKEAGFDQAPDTWSELKDAAKKLADRGEGQYGIDIDRNDQINPFIFAWQNGYEADLANKDLNFESPEFKEAMEYYVSYFEQGLSQKEKGGDIIQGFKTGKKPIFFSGPWMIDIIQDKAPGIEGKWATAVMPKKESRTSSMGGSNLAVFHNTDKVDASLKFISYMTQVDTQLDWLETSNTLPSRTEAWEDSALKDDPMYETFGKQLEQTKPGIQTEQFERIAQELLATLEKVVVGDADLEKELEKFNKEAQELITED
ncbi:sugar ABC transporter substrate-binding protein [Pontibacillus marinus]|uniref:ABC transporter substrate-binding protein n=1 Tax=Pontibacillus marinus BH030004 = DSM 16465 TaxID=1385511 RepID=A0A0A5GGT4_9BACI|nr:sugar ABC transporter substrate-binding protein [Pontibacillus marinus]KGX91219.1 ABC transporter substrate-binding protein [Pontibacillus marinus BH030004 = DSM 16465]